MFDSHVLSYKANTCVYRDLGRTKESCYHCEESRYCTSFSTEAGVYAGVESAISDAKWLLNRPDLPSHQRVSLERAMAFTR
jgi:hypothetical protein